MKKFKAGLFGLGVVGSGLYKILNLNEELGICIEKIAVKNIDKAREIELPNGILTRSPDEILEDDSLDFVIELINDPEEAFQIVKQAFAKGKSVVSANKKMVALHHEELLKLQEKYKVKFFYEGAVCGSIPILRLLDQHFKSDHINSIKAIANGTCNFILSKMVDENQDYDSTLKDAQDLGFAELDPHSDVSGEDTRFKLSIMIYHAFGIFVHPADIPLQGIDQLDENVVQFAQKHQLKIKLVGEARNIGGVVNAMVEPQLINAKHDFYNIDNEYNGIISSADYVGDQFVKGKGAGSYPTALAVLSNLQDLKYGLAIAKLNSRNEFQYSNNASKDIYYIGGYKNKISGIKIIDSQEKHYLVRAAFSQLQKLKQENPDLYWVKIPEDIYAKLEKHEVLI